MLPVVRLSCLKLRVQHLVNMLLWSVTCCLAILSEMKGTAPCLYVIVTCCLAELSEIKGTAFVIVAIFTFLTNVLALVPKYIT